MFHSMQMISLLTALVVVVLIWAFSRKNPWYAVTNFAKELISSKRLLIVFIAMIGVLLVNKYELQWEESMGYHADFTSKVFQLEGHFVSNFQSLFHAPWVTDVTAFFYLVVFQGLIIASIGIYASEGKRAFIYATCCTVMINYLVAIPFYLFFPVNEVWSYAPSGTSFYMLEAFPNFEQVYRPLSGLNNCFPSLHTSISVSMAILAIRSGNRRWAACATVSASIIIFAIFYMGIHWLTDMIGGFTLAIIASTLGIKIGKWLTKPVQNEPLLTIAKETKKSL